MDLLKQAFPAMFVWPLNITWKVGRVFPDLAFEQGDCSFRNMPYLHADAKKPGDVLASKAWMSMPEFKACARYTVPRFCAFVLNVSQPLTEAGVLASLHIKPLPW
jgi:hypothetical protein